MGRVKYYAIEPDELTSNQQICSEGRFGIYRNLLKLFGELSFHELAGRVYQYKNHYNEPMVTEEEMGFALLRLVEEGLVGMINPGQPQEYFTEPDSIDIDEISSDFEGFF